MKNWAPIVLFAFLLLASGCDKYSGPIILNSSAVTVDITVQFSGGTCQKARLRAGAALWQKALRPIPEEILAESEGRRFVFNRGHLESAMKNITKPSEVVIEFDGSNFHVLTMTEAKQRGLR